MTLYDDNTNWAIPEPDLDFLPAPRPRTNEPSAEPEPEIQLLPAHKVRWNFDPEGVKPPFAHTVGLCARPGHPYELAVFGLTGRLAQAVLRCAGEQLVRDGLDPAEGLELDDVVSGYSARLRRAQDTSAFTAARELYGPDVEVWQVLVPDRFGRFPDSSDYSDNRDEQPFV
ncbi:DUF4262 domain-containing protein [Streptomyces microflavus]|uniref:DUF4262 domain-containing protein n=1 Tax=Streptomyces microflavus TaxID=1919 RepID=UPI00364CA09D